MRSDSTNQLTKNYQSAWDAIQEDWKRHLKSFDLAKSLVNHTSRMAATVGMDCNWGMIQKNAQPGLLLLQKVDWTTFTLTEHSSVRILNR